ncbi:MAG: Hpt domain-containing protein [Gemmatimonadaceae bacterium]|jgi:HPt (histidine-containing phosphotransfer) domain-containing protein|nr:Hpt domain-containing protein [Gemmatimonadaceae bacterium]
MSTPAALLTFFRQEATEYLDQLDQLLASESAEPPDAAAFLAHARALRGSAAMTRLGGLSEFAATIERVAGGLRGDELRWDPRLHFAVRGALTEMRALIARADAWTDNDQRAARTHSVALAAVAAGYLGSVLPAASPASPVIPIARLFPDDGLPGLVERNPSPPITIAERFRRDIAAAADGIARESANLSAGERGPQFLALCDALRRTLIGLSDVAESYGATSIATLAMRMARSSIERPAERIAIQAFAQLLMDRERSDSELAAQVRQHTANWPGDRSGAAAAIDAPATPAEAAARIPTPRMATPVTPTPTAPAVPWQTPLRTDAVAPAPATDGDIVPIESLLYRGADALARARVVRDELRSAWQRAGGAAIDPTAASLLDELSDLLDLAASA